MQRLRRLLNWKGRATRKDYWIAVAVFAASVAIALAIGGAVVALGLMVPGILLGALVVMLGSVVLSITASRRLKDRNRPVILFVLFVVGPQQLLNLIPRVKGFAGSIYVQGLLMLAALVIAVWAVVELGFLRGTTGRNRYGADPLQPEPAEVFS